MEELKRYAPAKEYVLKYGVILLILIAAVAVSFLMGRTVSVGTSGTAAHTDVAGKTSDALPTPTQAADSALAQENAALRQQIAELTTQLATSEATNAASQQMAEDLKKENEALKEDLAAAEAENDSLNREMGALQDEYTRFADQFGMTYYVVYEVRRTVGFPPSEDIMRVTTIVTKEAYLTMSIGDTVSSVTGNLSLPSNSWGVEWTATVVNMYFQPTWNSSAG